MGTPETNTNCSDKSLDDVELVAARFYGFVGINMSGYDLSDYPGQYIEVDDAWGGNFLLMLLANFVQREVIKTSYEVIGRDVWNIIRTIFPILFFMSRCSN